MLEFRVLDASALFGQIFNQRSKPYTLDCRGQRLSSTEFIVFHVPQIEDDEIGVVVEALKSGWLATGVESSSFGRILSDNWCWAGDFVNSCTAALHLALEAMELTKRPDSFGSLLFLAAPTTCEIHFGAFCW